MGVEEISKRNLQVKEKEQTEQSGKKILTGPPTDNGTQNEIHKQAVLDFSLAYLVYVMMLK